MALASSRLPARVSRSLSASRRERAAARIEARLALREAVTSPTALSRTERIFRREGAGSGGEASGSLRTASNWRAASRSPLAMAAALPFSRALAIWPRMSAMDAEAAAVAASRRDTRSEAIDTRGLRASSDEEKRRDLAGSGERDGAAGRGGGRAPTRASKREVKAFGVASRLAPS